MRVIHLARKPLSEGSVAANVLEHETGGINVDGCRVHTSGEDRAEMLKMSEGFAGRKMGRPELMNYGYEGSMPTKTLSVPHQSGRWPANLMLEHRPGCHRVGTVEVASTGNFPATQKSNPGAHGKMGGGWSGEISSERPMGDDGVETLIAWECEPDCPVRHLDEDAGDRKAGGTPPSRGKICGTSIGGDGRYGVQPVVQEDVEITVPPSSGGASRFYKCIGGGSE